MSKHIRHSLNKRSKLACRVLPGVLLLAVTLHLALCSSTAWSNSSTPLLPSDFSGFKGVVVGDVCNLRSGPGTNYSVVGTVLEGRST